MNVIANMKHGWAEFQAMNAKDKRSKVIDVLLNNAIYILLIIFVIFTSTRNANFLTMSSLINIISLAASSLPIALGIGGCIVLTGTDLSAGRAVGLTAALSAAMLQATDWANKMFDTLPEMPIPVVILMVILVGGIVGLVNGFFVAKFSLHPFIVTLATQLIVYGILLEFYMLNGNNGQPLSERYLPQLHHRYDVQHPHRQRQQRGGALVRALRADPGRGHVVHLEQDHLWQEHVRRRLQPRSRQRLRRQRLYDDHARPHAGRLHVRHRRFHRVRAYRLQHGEHRFEL